MKRSALFLAPMLAFALACTTVAEDAPEAPATPDTPVAPDQPAEPARPGITRAPRGTDISEIKSDPFKLVGAVIENDILKVTVTYSGGAEDHDLAIYWNGISTRSMPPQLPMAIKHDAHGDAAEALITKTFEFHLNGINKPAVLNLHTDHGDSASVRYGERR